MSDNPQYGTQATFALPGIRVLTLTGRDAHAFAQAQFMNDVAALADGEWQWSGWLDPKGRVQALFLLARLDAQSLMLVTTADVATLAASLRRFVFRSKVVIETPDLPVSGRFGAPTATGRTLWRAGDVVEFDSSGAAGARTLLVGAAGDIDEAAESRWWALDIAHGWPALPGTALANWTPQQLSLQRLNAFSVKKGCYPGQEIVARTHFLGRVKRGLVRLRARGATPGTVMSDESGRAVGEIVCVVGDEALAVVPIDAADNALRLGAQPVDRLDLAEGLAR